MWGAYARNRRPTVTAHYLYARQTPCYHSRCWLSVTSCITRFIVHQKGRWIYYRFIWLSLTGWNPNLQLPPLHFLKTAGNLRGNGIGLATMKKSVQIPVTVGLLLRAWAPHIYPSSYNSNKPLNRMVEFQCSFHKIIIIKSRYRLHVSESRNWQ